jgi:hypothetical protein
LIYSEENNILECVEKLRPERLTNICVTNVSDRDLISPGIENSFNVILYLSTCHTVYISVLIMFMIMPYLIINTYVGLMCELKEIGKEFASKFVGTGRGPRLIKKNYRAAVSQKLRNTVLDHTQRRATVGRAPVDE